MERIEKRLSALHDEVNDRVEKKTHRVEFLSGIMAGHQHRVSLTLRNGKIVGNSERVNGHVHKVDQSVTEGDVLGFTDVQDQHKHRLNFTDKELKLAAKNAKQGK